MNISAIRFNNVNFSGNKNIQTTEKQTSDVQEKEIRCTDLFPYPAGSFRPYTRFEYKKDLIEQVKDNAQYENKKFDLHFAKLLCSAVKRYPSENPPVKFIARELKNAISKDPNHNIQVTDGFSRTLALCPISADSKEFEELFPISFNPVSGKYDEEANKTLCELLTKTEKTDGRTELIQSYFAISKDSSTGELNPNRPSVNEFLSNI